MYSLYSYGIYHAAGQVRHIKPIVIIQGND